MKTLSILAGLTILCLVSSQNSPVSETDTTPASDDPVYDDDEREKWIFSDGEKTADQIQNEEIMWEIDLDVQKARGFMQGWFRGFYKDFDWEIQPACFSKESVKYVYYF